ncbi:MAG: hypothetical protein F4Z57_12100 [Gemmatimonadetes bacterium]|nr:hypothetical protein [Gemmatimonadota bacterium]MDE2741162.1 hypothetical protein [Gemmatimonadota bacterium]MXW79699.1 hypothetical protein [Gemmatimonadota bacterium]MYC72705.1 hypothetical protein [Gemmatimonadota bacterium]MYI63162.1 hypothetical protein [Gemmatimonadota bacterium]
MLIGERIHSDDNATDTFQHRGNGATTGYEAALWQMADALRGSMDAAIDANLKALGFGDKQ